MEEAMDMPFNTDSVVSINSAHIEAPLPETFNIGLLTKKCLFCGGRYFDTEVRYSSCCKNGYVALRGKHELKPVPNIIKQFVNGLTQNSLQFLEHIRDYNNALAFASLIVTHSCTTSSIDPPIFTVHGQMYHLVSDVNTKSEPKYCQLYFIESNEANHERCTKNRVLNV